MDTATLLTPEVINDLFQSACQLHQDGRLDEAKAIYHELLDHIDAPLLHYNLGLIYYAQEEMGSALACFEHALAGNPEDTDSLFNLALCQKNCGRLEEASRSFMKLLDQDPNNVDTLYNLASCQRERRNDEEAIALYLKVLELAPDHRSATSNLAYMYQLTDDTARAIHYYQKLLELTPGHAAAKHMLASLLGNTPDSPPESYVRDIFDNYSDHYEESLVKNLQYNVPEQLRKHFNQLPNVPARFSHGIDLGCGTGLSGIAFNDIITILDGVDLSEKMLALAKEKQIYHSLVVGNISDALKGTNSTYDFAIAADVFAYFGNLHETFRLLSACTSPGSVFCFSTEAGSEERYALRPSGRFSHGHQYIRDLAAEFRWSIELQESTNLRMERGGWVSGYLWILRKIPVPKS